MCGLYQEWYRPCQAHNSLIRSDEGLTLHKIKTSTRFLIITRPLIPLLVGLSTYNTPKKCDDKKFASLSHKQKEFPSSTEVCCFSIFIQWFSRGYRDRGQTQENSACSRNQSECRIRRIPPTRALRKKLTFQRFPVDEALQKTVPTN